MSYHLTILTPQGRRYEGEVMHTRVPAEIGSIGVLTDHAPLVTSSCGGVIEITEKEGGTKKFSIGAGFFEIAGNKAVLLTQSFKD
jgi:F-type H+-transporting ATPase subunit epsilon